MIAVTTVAITATAPTTYAIKSDVIIWNLAKLGMYFFVADVYYID